MRIANYDDDPIVRSRMRLVREFPFYGSLALRLRLFPTPAVETAGVDGVSLFYNVAFCASLSDDVRLTLLAHEVLHCALLHFARRGARDLKLWNRATDFAVNLILKDSGFLLWEGALLDERFRGLGAEGIYAKLEEEARQAQPQNPSPKSNGQGGAAAPSGGPGASDQDGEDGEGDGSGSGGGEAGWPAVAESKADPSTWGWVEEPISDPSASEATGREEEGNAAAEPGRDPKDVEHSWTTAVEIATMVATKAGTLPGGAERVAAELAEPVVDWRSVVRPYLSAPTRSSFARPNRRFLASGPILPGRIKDALDDVVVFEDTSGSVTDKMIGMFNSEMREFFSMNERPRRIHFVYVDADVQKTEEVEDFVDLTKPVGGGGTRFKPAFDWVREQGIEPSVALYLTDLDNSDPDEIEDPGYPVIWLTPAWVTKEAPFGETVRMVE